MSTKGKVYKQFLSIPESKKFLLIRPLSFGHLYRQLLLVSEASSAEEETISSNLMTLKYSNSKLTLLGGPADGRTIPDWVDVQCERDFRMKLETGWEMKKIVDCRERVKEKNPQFILPGNFCWSAMGNCKKTNCIFSSIPFISSINSATLFKIPFCRRKCILQQKKISAQPSSPDPSISPKRTLLMGNIFALTESLRNDFTRNPSSCVTVLLFEKKIWEHVLKVLLSPKKVNVATRMRKE